MDCQHWLADLELPTAFWVNPKLFDNKKQEAGGGCVVSWRPDGKCRLNIRDGSLIPRDIFKVLLRMDRERSSKSPRFSERKQREVHRMFSNLVLQMSDEQ